MERLTHSIPYDDGSQWFEIRETNGDLCSIVCDRQNGSCDNCPIKKAVERLAAYEDSGLEPEEVKSAYEAGRQDALLEPDWISVKDMLPDEEDNVLLLVREVEHYGIHGRKRKVYRLVFTGWRIDDEWATFYCNGHQMLDEEDKKHPNCQFTVTHWMPLPKPPKEV